jgi:transposase-like protein
MVMPLIPLETTRLSFAKTLADGAGTEGGRRPTVVPAPSAASPELGARPRRRTFPATEKLRILREVDAAGPGGIGAILRREGIYSSLLTDWRRQRDAGAYEALKAVKRGPKPAPVFLPSVDEHARLRRENASLTLRLQRAEAIIDIQKKVASLLGLSMPSDEAS